MNIAMKLVTYLKESKTELKKVIWPNKNTTISHTVMVVLFSLGVALFLAAVDYLFTYVYNVIIK